MKKFTIEQYPNGNYFVEVHEDKKVLIQRAYTPEDLKSIVSLLLLTFPSHVHSRQN